MTPLPRRRLPVPEGELIHASPAAEAEGATVLACPLCGGRFTHGRRACGACPLARGCDLITCPDCGYTFPRSSRLAHWAERLWRAAWRRTR
jgi:hypothetical protein